MKSRYNIIMCGILTVASLLLTGCGIFPEEEVFETATLVSEYEKKEFSLVSVQRGDVCDYRRIACKYRESNTQDIELGIWDVVSDIYVKKGDKVKKGDVLFTFGYEDFDDQIEDYKYQIGVKETLIKQDEKNKKLEIEKQKIVLDDKALIKAIEERYDAQISGYKSELELLRMRLDKAESDKESLQVRAEMDGKVTFLDTMLLNRNPWFDGEDSWSPEEPEKNTLMVISDNSKPRFTGAVDFEDIELADGQQIDVICDSNTYTTTVRYKDEKTVQFMLDSVPEDIKDGVTAYAKYIISEKKDVLYLPESAVTSMGEEAIVYMDDGNGFKKPVTVQTGLTADNKTEIVSGLQEGDVVIVR